MTADEPGVGAGPALEQIGVGVVVSAQASDNDLNLAPLLATSSKTLRNGCH